MKTFSGRLYGLDAARTALMLLGLVVHAGSLAATNQTVTGSFADGLATGFSILAHNFRMPAFFLVSGILASLLMVKRGPAGFWLQRKRRLLYPLLVGAVTIVPLTYLAEGLQVSSPLDLFNSGFAHLWFIEYLLIFSLILLLIRQTFSITTTSKDRGRNLALGFWIVNPISIALLVALTLLIPDWFDAKASALAPSSALLPPVGLFVFYLLFFLFGTLLYCCLESVLVWLRRFAFVYAAIGAIAFAVYASFIWGGANEAWSRPAYATATWMLSLAVIAMTTLLVKREYKQIKYLSEASYWVYLIHLPMMVLLQKWFAQLHLGVALSFWISLPIVFGIAIGLYQWLVRDRFIGKLLAGKL